MRKKRAEWKIRLVRSNLKPSEGCLFPQVVLKGAYTLDDIIERLAKDQACGLNAETLRHAATALFNEMEDYLLDGSSVHLPLGILTPSVTGLWDTNRLQPEARRKNEATVRFSLSPRLKKALADPLLHETDVAASRLAIYTVEDSGSRTINERITRGLSISLTGSMLLMNGTSPERGLYLLRAGTEEVVLHIPPESFIRCTRRNIIALIPRDLPKGEYNLRVVSQCTTSPRPLNTPAVYTMPSVLVVVDLQENKE